MTDPADIWNTINSPRHAAGHLGALLVELANKWQPGTLAAELARALVSEQRPRDPVRPPAPLILENLTNLEKTRRIDGILPLTVPSPNHIGRCVSELVSEATRLDLGPPPDDETELTLALLTLLHRRSLVTDNRLRIELTLACPGGTLLVLGQLPLGGRTTIAVTSIDPHLHCNFDPADAVYLDHLTLNRTPNGILTLQKP